MSGSQHVISTDAKEIKSPLDIKYPLDVDNYSVWMWKIVPMLRHNGLLKVTIENNVQIFEFLDSEQVKEIGHLAMTINISTDIAPLFKNYFSGKAIWDSIQSTYGGVNNARKLSGILALCKFKFDQNNPKGSTAKLRTILNETITAADATVISFADLAQAMLIHSLPPPYFQVRSLLTHNDDKEVSLDASIALILKESELIRSSGDLGGAKKDFAGYVKNWPKGTKLCKAHNWKADTCHKCDPSKLSKNSTCQDCHQKGHKSMMSSFCSRFEKPEIAKFARDADTDRDLLKPFAGMVNHENLPKRDLRDQIESSRAAKRSRAEGIFNHIDTSTEYLLLSKMSDATRKTIIDSGCSKSIFQNKNDLTDYVNSIKRISTADAEANDLLSPGNGSLQLNGYLKLQKVLHCPTVSLNLLSVSQLADLNLIIIFDKYKCEVRRIENNELVLRGKREGNIYVYNRPTDTAMVTQGKLTATRTVLFHRRMGHINYGDLRHLEHISEGVLLDKSTVEPPLCLSCLNSKCTRRHFQKSESHAKRYGDLTHSDICFINVPTVVGNFIMFILFVDDATRWISCYLLKNKSDTEDAFKDYDAIMLNRSKRHCQILRSDNDNVYFNKGVESYCQMHGILQQSSTIYTSQQNGRAERPNRTIVEMAHAMLSEANLPLSYWGFAVLYAVYIKNRSPHSALNRITPYQAKTGQLPDLSSIRVFGSSAYTLIPKEKRKGPGNKFLDKTERLIFIGFSERFKAWQMIHPDSHAIIHSSEAVFVETFTDLPTVASKAELASMLPTDTSPESTISEELATPESPIVDRLSTDPIAEGDVETDSKISDPTIDTQNDMTDAESVGSSASDSSNQSDLDPLTMLASAYSTELDLTPEVMHDLLVEDQMPNDLNPTFKEAMVGPFKLQFIAAIKKEYDSLAQNKVFSEPLDLPKGFKAIDTKMVLKIKEPEFHNETPIYKARLCGKGFRQIFGVDYFETYSPVATYDSMRIFLTLMAMMDFELDVVDVITAFLLSPLKEEVYIKIPDGYDIGATDTRKVLRLLKSLYGLKQAPRDWNANLDSYLRQLGFKPLQNDRCLYVGRFGNDGLTVCYILVYVDDMILACKDRIIMKELKSKIHSKFPIKDKGPISFFLNMHIVRDRSTRTIRIHQMPKIERLLSDNRLTITERQIISKPCKIPAQDKDLLTKDMCPVTDKEKQEMVKVPYRSFIGMLLYISVTARPDIATAVSSAARYSHNPGRLHWNAVLQILRYLQGTRILKLQLGGKSTQFMLTSNFSLVKASADADWATERDDRRSRTGFAIYLFSSLIIWSSKLQPTISQSSTEAEYLSLASCARFLLWVRNLLQEMGFPSSAASIIEQDNKACINIAESYKSHPAVKHIDVRHHFLRDQILTQKTIELVKTDTTEMISDLFTKQLVYTIFRKHRERLGLVE